MAPDWTAIEDRIDRTIRDSALAEPVIYTSWGGTPRPIRAVFSPTSVELDPATAAPVRSVRPMLSVRPSDLEFDLEAGDGPDEVNVRGVEYQVIEAPERIGADWAELHLHTKDA